MIPNMRNYDTKQQADIRQMSACFILLHLQSIMNNVKPKNSTEERRAVIKAYIQSRYNREPSLSELASMVGMTAESLSRYMSCKMGMPFSKWLIRQRLSAAEQELRVTGLAISEICYRCGYSTLSNFNRQFKSAYGCTPTEYRMKAKG